YSFLLYIDLLSFPTRRSSDLSIVIKTRGIVCLFGRSRQFVLCTTIFPFWNLMRSSRYLILLILYIAHCSPIKCFNFTLGGEGSRSEEHTSELQSQSNLVCRLL